MREFLVSEASGAKRRRHTMVNRLFGGNDENGGSNRKGPLFGISWVKRYSTICSRSSFETTRRETRVAPDRRDEEICN